MGYDQKRIREDVLSVIEAGNVERAVENWISLRQSMPGGCSRCTHVEMGQSADCRLCMESKLLMMSLYSGDTVGIGASLLNGVRAMKGMAYA
ncbi:MAG: hypothetical protein HQL36_06200 [Alphaproteobacteria bacterium]|nr:hypothetical protein [Alphaproteobacteria bacterium]MBF0250605.1 hypothetical protein [Alphaproteobacteria bacterium]